MFNLKFSMGLPWFRQNKEGVVLFIVLGTLLVVVILANVVLSIILSQSRLTHHQVSRIQAYYAAQAGINYALEMIKLGNTDWIPSPDTVPNTQLRRLCRQGCSAPDVNEPNLPSSVQRVDITIGAAGSGISATRQINATVIYTYTP